MQLKQRVGELTAELGTAVQERDDYRGRPVREEYERLAAQNADLRREVDESRRAAEARDEEFARRLSQATNSAVQNYKVSLRKLVDAEFIGVPDGPADDLSEDDVSVLAAKYRNVRDVLRGEKILRD